MFHTGSVKHLNSRFLGFLSLFLEILELFIDKNQNIGIFSIRSFVKKSILNMGTTERRQTLLLLNAIRWLIKLLSPLFLYLIMLRKFDIVYLGAVSSVGRPAAEAGF